MLSRFLQNLILSTLLHANETTKDRIQFYNIILIYYSMPIKQSILGPLHSRSKPQALVSFKKYMPPLLPYFKVNVCPLPLPHFVSICFAYLWSYRWPNYIVTLPRYFSFRLPHLIINTGPPSNELDKIIQRKSHFLFFSQWNRYNHFRFALDFSYAFGIL